MKRSPAGAVYEAPRPQDGPCEALESLRIDTGQLADVLMPAGYLVNR